MSLERNNVKIKIEMRKNLLWMLSLVAGLSFAMACSDDNDEESTGSSGNPNTGTGSNDTLTYHHVFEISADTIYVAANPSVIHFTTTTDLPFELSTEDEWLTIVSDGRSVNEYTATVEVEKNSVEEQRIGQILADFQDGTDDEYLTVTIIQSAYNPDGNNDEPDVAVVIYRDTVEISEYEQEVVFETNTIKGYDVTVSDSTWLSYVGFDASAMTMTIRAELNEYYERTGYVYMTYTAGDTTFVYTIVQERTSNIIWTNLWNDWPEYPDAPYYNYLESGDVYDEPTADVPIRAYINSTDEKAGNYEIIDEGHWAFYAGPKKNHLVDSTCVIPMLEEFNYRFDYLRDKMGWPPDYAYQLGYRSMITLYGSGLDKIDTADSTATGGWQSAVSWGGKSIPMVTLSYYPVYCFSPKCTYSDRESQKPASIHEGIHAVFATLPGCKDCSWFHEGANTWLQGALYIQMDLEDDPNIDLSTQEFGWLCAGTIMAPFMPVETYGGWLDDESFAGPAAQGNTGYNTHYILGGSQYSSVFPSFLEIAMTRYAMPWIWQNVKKGYILKGFETYAGMSSDEIHRLLMEFRARLCLDDMGVWTGAVANMYSGNWGFSSYSEHGNGATLRVYPYVQTTVDSDGWYIPNETTLPGWSGCNIIPLLVNSDTVAVTYESLTDSPMHMQLCYNTKDGTPWYSDIAMESGATISINLEGREPANKCIFVIVCNMEYEYTDSIRYNHYNYKIKPLYGVSGAASYTKKWYSYSSNL